MTFSRRFLLLSAAFSLAGTLIAAPQPKRGAKPADPDETEVFNFRLTSNNFNQFANASSAVLKVTQTNPALREQLSEDQQGKTINQSVEIIERKYPTVTTAIKTSGLSTHDFVVMTATILTTTMAVGMKKQGVIKEIPSIVSAENAAFVDQNYDNVTSLMKKLQSDGK
jgi:hypothetical protein